MHNDLLRVDRFRNSIAFFTIETGGPPKDRVMQSASSIIMHCW